MQLACACFYVPNFREVGGILLAVVYPLVRPFVTFFGMSGILRTVHARILKFYKCIAEGKIADLYFCRTCFSLGDLGICPSFRQHLPWVSCEHNSSYSFVLIILNVFFMV